MNAENLADSGVCRRILIVDDDQMGTEIRAAVLRFHGFSVETVNSGQEALSKTVQSNFDVIILDFDMPGMNGLQVAESLREQRCRSIIVMLSGRLEVPEGPGAQFLTKFFSKGDTQENLLQFLAKV